MFQAPFVLLCIGHATATGASFPVTPAGWSSRLARFPTIPGWRFWAASGGSSFDPDPAKAKRLWGGDQFRFVHHVNIGPYFIRRQSYEALGGWEYSFSGHSLFGGAAGFWGTLTKCGGQLLLGQQSARAPILKGWLAHHRGYGLPSSMSWWSAKSRSSGRSTSSTLLPLMCSSPSRGFVTDEKHPVKW